LKFSFALGQVGSKMKNNLHKREPGERPKVTQSTDFWDQTYDYSNPNVTKTKCIGGDTEYGILIDDPTL
jgi:hypothetical protein